MTNKRTEDSFHINIQPRSNFPNW